MRTGSPTECALLGNYGTDLYLEAGNQSLPDGGRLPTAQLPFVRFGIQRGELRKDLDLEMIVSILDWMMERFQDALLTEELRSWPVPVVKEKLVSVRKLASHQFLDILQRAIGSDMTLHGHCSRGQRPNDQAGLGRRDSYKLQ